MKKKPEISMYYLDGDPFVWQPKQLRADFEAMRRIGADSVCISVLESHTSDYPGKVALARSAGLKVYAIPSRVGGFFAGWPKVASLFAARHPEYLVLTRDGRFQGATAGSVCCPNQPAFRAWFLEWLEKLLDESGVDGVVYDEPKEAHVPCWCPACRKLCPDQDEAARVRFREASVAGLLGEACRLVKRSRPDRTNILFVMPDATGHFKTRILEQPELDYFGNDGPVCHQGEPEQTHQKTSLFDSVPAIFRLADQAGKKRFTLVETFSIHSGAMAELARNLPRVAEWQADLYAFYFYGTGNQEPERVMELSAEAIARIKG